MELGLRVSDLVLMDEGIAFKVQGLAFSAAAARAQSVAASRAATADAFSAAAC